MTRSVWDKRIERASELEKTSPSSAELLGFYREIAGFQAQVARSCAKESPQLTTAHLLPHLKPLLALVRRSAPPELAQAARELSCDPARWPSLLRDDADPADSSHAFFVRVLMQPYSEFLASHSDISLRDVRPACPYCDEKPVAAVLRPEGDGGKRFLLCSLCSTEWEFRRLLCPCCGEEDKDKLPVYTAEEFPHIRVETCDTCRFYLKAIDLTRNGLAVPEVDEIASVTLDLWARDKGYTKLQTNLFGM